MVVYLLSCWTMTPVPFEPRLALGLVRYRPLIWPIELKIRIIASLSAEHVHEPHASADNIPDGSEEDREGKGSENYGA